MAKNIQMGPYLALLIISILMNCSVDSKEPLPHMKLKPGSEREIAYTDKQDAFWVTRSGGYNSSPWHGLTASKRAYFEDLFIYADGHLLPREMAVVDVDPARLIREYPDLGIRSTWSLIDNKRTLMIQLEAESATDWKIQPAILGGSAADDFEIKCSEREMNIHIKRLAHMTSSYPYLKIWFSQPMQWQDAESPDLQLYTAFLTQRAEYSASHRLVIMISLHDKPADLDIQPSHIESARSDRYNRLKSRLQRTRFISNNAELDAAIAWAHASLDALIMKQMGKGIYAGLPWFDDYWGRDTFISFAGGVLVSGGFEDAREILLSFADLQNTKADDPNYGRIPNRAQPEDIIYNTTDGTPWFVRSVWDYFRYTGDLDFLSGMWPGIRLATEGALLNWTDESGLLRHADADTWMDARGPDGPWSPRGNRAIDIQFIWRDQLEITRRLAKLYGETEFEQDLIKILAKLETGLKTFISVDGSYMVDHLNADNSQDQQIRPNIFLVPALFQETCDWSSFKTLAPQLVSLEGVLSLSQDDSNFHPYHHLAGLYVQDAAYHNGIIWTWNSAATITPATNFHQYQYVQAIHDKLTDQIINRGSIGTISELTDAWPRDGDTRLSGTFSQAWSLAEYLRSFYQDILGVQPDLSESKVRIAPRLLAGMEQINFAVPLGTDSWDINYTDTKSGLDISIVRTNSQKIDLLFEVLHGSNLSRLNLSWPGTQIHIRFEKQMGQWSVPGDIEDYQMSTEAIDIPMNSLAFVALDTNRVVPVLLGPKHRLLDADEVVQSEGSGKTLLRVTDPEHDDRGDSGSYVYPSNPQFGSGIADIISAEIGVSDQSYHFELQFSNLVDPGWHPEYGYQLTYTAIGISYNSQTGIRELGKNSKALFKSGFRADQILYICGGLLLVDGDHHPVAEYMPRSPKGALGSSITEKVRFRMPKEIFEGDLADARFQVAVGCQDDHGGAGIGDFREVESNVSEWTGGGKINGEGSNVYDWLLP
ncbi:hypothetical protein HQ531_07145 [bacterium]|nr:hypothetical protein [bacterium]